MAEVRSFRGILYDPETAGPFETVVAPPYDVIGPEEQASLYDRSAYNVIRIDFAREEDRYGSAAQVWRQWLESGVVRRDEAPAVYGYSQRFRVGDQEYDRFGFFGRLHLEDFSSGIVLPHERTLPSAKEDRLRLQRACRANLSPIFGLYGAPEWRARDALVGSEDAPPLMDFADVAGIHHRFWRVTDPDAVLQVTEHLADRTVYIADGHHRYETALRYRDEMREATGLRDGRQPFDYVLAFLVNFDEPGLVVLPTHRVFRNLHVGTEELLEAAGRHFRIERIPSSGGTDAFLGALRNPEPGERRLGAVFSDREDCFLFVARDGKNDDAVGGAAALCRLDVTLLHGLVLEGILRLDANEEHEAGRLVYVKDDVQAIDRVRRHGFAAAFLMNPTRVDEMRAVCESGETMPEKSTYFYPKVPTGLVFHPLEEE